MDKVAVLLLNLGGPDSPQSIKPFLRNLFLDREIIKLPLQPIVARIIASSRAKKVRTRYEAIGGKSPILEQTERQAIALESALNEQGKTYKVYIGMRYWHPFIKDTVKKIIDDKPDKLIVLPLYPHYSKATTGSCFKEARKAIDEFGPGIEVIYKESWYNNGYYLDSLAATINEGLEKFPTEERRLVYILFSAHSLPQKFIEEGDPYLKQLQETIDNVTKKIDSHEHRLAFQSRSGPVKWMEPPTDKEIVRLANKGVENLLVVPVSFVSDHVETLYEIDVMYKDLAVKNGIKHFERTPSLNSRPDFISALKNIVEG
jgi:ferrochelatase